MHAACLLSFIVLLFPAMLIFALGLHADLLWPQLIATVMMALASFFLGLDGVMLVRGFGAALDFYEWDRAGRPDTWTYRESSQLRGTDLVAIGVLSGLLAAFFAKLMLG